MAWFDPQDLVKTIAQHIDAVRANGDAAAGAAAALATGSRDAAPAMRDALRRGGPGVAVLTAALIDLEGRIEVDLFAGLVTADDRHTVGAAIRALAASRDARAVAPLAGLLDGGSVRSAIVALGDLRHPDAIAPLRARLARCLTVVEIETAPPSARVRAGGDWAELEHLPYLIAALAKLGDDTAASLLHPCLHATSDDPDGYDDPEEIRREAVAAMKWAVVPGMLEPLRAAARAPSTEIAEHAIDALFYLGAPAAVDALFAVGTECEGSRRALLRLNDLLGRSGGKDATLKALAARWPKLRRSLAPSTCIRNGAPIDLRTLVPLVADARLRGAVLDELAVITGETFGHDPRLGERGWVDYSPRVAGWVADHAADYAVGACHKGGRPVDLVALVA